MGQLKGKEIVQSRHYLDPNMTPIPPYDFNYTFPITVYEAVKQTTDDNAANLKDELDSIYRLISGKQDIIEGGTSGYIMTWTGMKGHIGSMEVVKSINTEPSLRSHQKVASERALGDLLDTKVSKQNFNLHVTNNSIHISDIERTRWNSMAPLSSLQAHVGNTNVHVTEAEKRRWNSMAGQESFDNHIYDVDNPHNVTAHQVGTYTRRELDEMFENIRESFFNYSNISWDERNNQAELVEYHPANWNPNYVLGFGDSLPEVPDPTLTYFALKPATDYKVNETQDCLIYIKRPGLIWQEVGFQNMNVGDMVIRYPDTTMFVWVQGRFLRLFTGNLVNNGGSSSGGSSSGGGTGGGTGSGNTGSTNPGDDFESIIGGINNKMWRPVIDESGELIWIMSTETTPPDPIKIKGEDGYTPIKGVDYVDGKDGQGVAVGGNAGEVLVKLTDENYDTTWKNLLDVLGDLVISGGTLPDGVVSWDQITNRPEIFDKLGDNENGFVTQKVVTKEFESIRESINQIIERIDGTNGSGGIDSIKDDIFDHINDFNNPHRVTASMIGAVSNATFADHTQNFNNPHNVNANQIGLGNVDNTSDLDKPISSATQEAINTINEKIKLITGNVDNFNYISNVIWDDTTAILSFTFRDGSTIDINIPIADIFNSIYFDDTETELVIVLPDGSEHRIDIESLIQVYTGGISENIQVTVSDNNAIKATILSGSIGELELTPSIHLRSSPTTTTQPTSDKSNRIATTEYVRNQVIDNLISYETDRPLSANMGRILNQRKADTEDVINIINDLEGIDVIDNLDSTNPEAALSANMGRYLDLTKSPRVHTSPSGSTFGRGTVSLFGHTRASDIDPLMDGTVFRGTDDGYYARADHRHPTDTTRAPIHWPDVGHDQYEMTGEPRAVIAPDDSNDNRIVTTEWVRRNAVGVAIGECNTRGDEAIKVATLRSDFMKDPVFIRQSGSTVAISFSEMDISTSPTMLDVHGSGPAPITYGGIGITPRMIKADYTHIFTYDGTSWKILNPVGIHTLPDEDNSNSHVSSEWVRRNAVGMNYGVCKTASGITEKAVTLQSTFMEPPVFFLRQIGSSVAVTFMNEDRSGHKTPTTLNVEGTGAAEILYGGFYMKNGMIGKNHTHIFVFDGIYWRLINPVAGTGLDGEYGPNVPLWPDESDDTIFTVTFDPQGGTVTPTSMKTNTSSRLAFLPTPTKADYIFDGWWSVAGTGGSRIEITNVYPNDTTIYARWILKQDDQITITLDPMEGHVSPNKLVTRPNVAIGVLPTPSRSGYIFGGWFTTKITGGYPVYNTTTFSSNTTIYARWDLDETKDEVINRVSGYQGFTTAGDGEIDNQGNVNHVYIAMRYEQKPNDVRIEVSRGENDFACLFGNGTQIRAFSPKVVSVNSFSALIQFQIESTYPSNSPVQLIYTRSTAYLKIIEIDEDGNDINNEQESTRPIITTVNLPDGIMGIPYSTTLKANGETPMVWRLHNGNLPSGLTISTGGVISGTPTVIGKSSFSVQVVNNSGNMIGTFSINIDYPPVPEE